MILREAYHSLMFQTPNKYRPEASVFSKRQLCLRWKLLKPEKHHKASFNVDWQFKWLENVAATPKPFSSYQPCKSAVVIRRCGDCHRLCHQGLSLLLLLLLLLLLWRRRRRRRWRDKFSVWYVRPPNCLRYYNPIAKNESEDSKEFSTLLNFNFPCIAYNTSKLTLNWEDLYFRK